MRVVLISRVLPAVVGYSALLRELGHEPVALMCSRELAERYGGLGDLLAGAPADLDVVIPASRDRIAPLLRRSSRTLPSAWASRGRSRQTLSAFRSTGSSTGIPRSCPATAGRTGGLGDPQRRAGDRVHLPLHGRRARHRQRARAGPNTTGRRAELGGPRAQVRPGDRRDLPVGARRVEQRRPGRSAARGGGDLLLLLRARVRLDRLGAAGRRDRAAGSRLALPLTGSAARGADGAGRRGRARARREPRARGRPRDALR